MSYVRERFGCPKSQYLVTTTGLLSVWWIRQCVKGVGDSSALTHKWVAMTHRAAQLTTQGDHIEFGSALTDEAMQFFKYLAQAVI